MVAAVEAKCGHRAGAGMVLQIKFARWHSAGRSLDSGWRETRPLISRRRLRPPSLVLSGGASRSAGEISLGPALSSIANRIEGNSAQASRNLIIQHRRRPARRYKRVQSALGLPARPQTRLHGEQHAESDAHCWPRYVNFRRRSELRGRRGRRRSRRCGRAIESNQAGAGAFDLAEVA